MIKDISLHFQTGTQTAKDACVLFDEFLSKNEFKIEGKKLLSNPDRTNIKIKDELFSICTEIGTVINHCFLPKEVLKELGKDESVYDDFIDLKAEYSYQKRCWYGATGESIFTNRALMFTQIKQNQGYAFFIGEITGGVLLEYEMASQILNPNQIIKIGG